MTHRDRGRYRAHTGAGSSDGSIPGSLLFVLLVPVMKGEESWQVSSRSMRAALAVLCIPLANKHLSGVHPAFPREQTFRQGSAI